MTKIKYVEHEGTEHVVDVPDGMSVMEGAVRYTIPGIDGDCGGSCACATCHCYVDESRLGDIPPAAENELAMLENVASERKPNSRLACQIKASAKLEGLRVLLPATQE